MFHVLINAIIDLEKKTTLPVSRYFRKLPLCETICLRLCDSGLRSHRYRKSDVGVAQLIGARLGASCQGLIIFPRVRRFIRLARAAKNINVFTLTVSHLNRYWYRRWRRQLYVFARNERWTLSMGNGLAAQPLDISRFLVNHPSFVSVSKTDYYSLVCMSFESRCRDNRIMRDVRLNNDSTNRSLRSYVEIYLN